MTIVSATCNESVNSQAVNKPSGFEYTPTDSYVKYVFSEGGWDGGELVNGEPFVRIHIMSAALHYGQTLFEGLKAFRCKDGAVRVFNQLANLDRLNKGCRRLLLPELPQHIFEEAIERVIQANARFVPDFGTGGSLYIRPLVLGTGPRLGLGPSPECTFIVLVNPVGSYYSTGAEEACPAPVKALVIDEFDRAAPLGVGHIKVGGNYAADLLPSAQVKSKGFQIGLYLDAIEHRYIEEFSTSNFVAISKDGSKFVTPQSTSVLQSNTNLVLQQLAKDMGLTVECRPVLFEELRDFAEVAAVGTAVVLTPIASITRGGDTVSFECETLQTLYQRVRAIQTGREPDIHKWMTTVDVDTAAK